MILKDGRKLIYYPVGNHFQLFDLTRDPREETDLAGDPASGEVMRSLTDLLVGELYGSDLGWLRDGKLVGRPNRPYRWAPHRSLNSQRGDGWPPSPKVEIPQIEWTRERSRT